jgi:hypothetical protein
MTTESDIMHDDNAFAWVLREPRRKRYTVLRYNFTHSVEDSAFPLTPDGLSLAIARAKYISRAELKRAALQ